MTNGYDGDNGDVPDGSETPNETPDPGLETSGDVPHIPHDPDTPRVTPDPGSVMPGGTPLHDDHEPGGHRHPIRNTYFIPGELLLYAAYDTGKPRDDSEGLNKWVNDILTECWSSLQKKSSGQPKRKLPDFKVKLLPVEAGQNTGVIKVTFPDWLDKPDDPDLIYGHQDAAKIKQQKDYCAELAQQDQDLAGILNEMNKKGNNNAGGMTLRVAAPNWLFSTMGHAFGHPSPGGWPVPVAAASLRPRQQDFKTGLIDRVIRACQRRAAPEVDVVIFDTVPPEQPTAIAERTSEIEVVTTFPTPWNAACTVFRNLCQGRSTFDRQFVGIARAGALGYAGTIPTPPPADGREIPDPHYTNRDGHNVSDHGVFIAGIVHSLAPRAKIHLVEVMNTHGVGTLESLIAGVEALLRGAKYTQKDADGQEITSELPKPKAGRTLIVNCSLALDVEGRETDPVITLPLGYELPNGLRVEWTVELDNPLVPDANYGRLFQPLHATFDDLEAAFASVLAGGGDGVIVAAAGNDGLPGHQPPPSARYPAAFDNVVGVGALENGSTRAWYSNLADNAPYQEEKDRVEKAAVKARAAGQTFSLERPPDRGVVVTGGSMDYVHLPADSAARVWNHTRADGGLLGLYLGNFPTWNTAHTQVVSDIRPSSGWARWSGTSFAAAVMSGVLARAASRGCTVNPKDRAKKDFLSKLRDAKMPLTQYGEIILPVRQGAPWWAPIWEWIRNTLGLNRGQ